MITSEVAIIIVFFMSDVNIDSSIVLISFIGFLFACLWNVKSTYKH